MRAAYFFNMINSNMINSRWAFEPEGEGNVQNYFLTFMQIFYSKWEIIKACLLMESQSELYIFILSQAYTCLNKYNIEQESLKLLNS